MVAVLKLNLEPVIRNASDRARFARMTLRTYLVAPKPTWDSWHFEFLLATKGQQTADLWIYDRAVRKAGHR